MCFICGFSAARLIVFEKLLKLQSTIFEPVANISEACIVLSL